MEKSYIGLGLSIFFESFGVPLPGESFVIAAGAAVKAGKLNGLLTFSIIWFCATLGDCVGYAIGWRFGKQVIINIGARFGLTEARWDGLADYFKRYDVWIVLVARFIPLLRQLNGLIAGSLRLRFSVFALANGIGAALWTGFWLTASSELAGPILDFLHRHPEAKTAGLAVIAAVLGLGIFFTFRNWRARSDSKG